MILQNLKKVSPKKPTRRSFVTEFMGSADATEQMFEDAVITGLFENMIQVPMVNQVGHVEDCPEFRIGFFPKTDYRPSLVAQVEFVAENVIVIYMGLFEFTIVNEKIRELFKVPSTMSSILNWEYELMPNFAPIGMRSYEDRTIHLLDSMKHELSDRSGFHNYLHMIDLDKIKHKARLEYYDLDKCVNWFLNDEIGKTWVHQDFKEYNRLWAHNAFVLVQMCKRCDMRMYPKDPTPVIDIDKARASAYLNSVQQKEPEEESVIDAVMKERSYTRMPPLIGG